MTQINNSTVSIYELDHIYIADTKDENAERRMLAEARVSKVVITPNGSVSFLFEVAGKGTFVDPKDITLYYDTQTYKSTAKIYKMTYSTTCAILSQLGINTDCYQIDKPTPSSDISLVPYGYIVNENLMIEAVDFPSSWEFTRKEIDNVVYWEHNANFYDTQIYATREDALSNQSIRLLKLNGTEVEI